MKDFLELAKTRRSVRTFDGNPVDPHVLQELKTFAEEMTNPFGVSLRFAFLDAEENKLSSPVLSGEKCYVTAMVEKGTPRLEEAYGYAFEKLLMKAQELGLGTVWIGGTMPREKFEKASALAENETMPCVSPLGVTAAKMAMKETLMRKGVKADTRKDFEELFCCGSFETPLTEDAARELGLYNALEAVRIAPSAVNKQPWRVLIDGNKAHFYEKHDNGYITADYDLQKIDIGIALFHFESQLICEGKQPTLECVQPGFPVPKGMDYVATYTF